jgi:recombinational DNA repair protein (RecF pathway)
MIEHKERGILLFSKISSENNLYLKILTQKDEIISGLSFGGSTKKKKNIFQIGYFLNIIIKNKNKNFPNTISAELSKPYYHNIFNDKYKLHSLLALVSLLNISIIEGQKVLGLFNLSENIIKILLNEKKWIINYFIFLLNLLKIIGYDIDYKKNTSKDYLNLDSLQFSNLSISKSIKFPHLLLNSKNDINLENASSFFRVFEIILQNHHLNNMNLNIPINYFIFKKIILNFLSRNEKLN